MKIYRCEKCGNVLSEDEAKKKKYTCCKVKMKDLASGECQKCRGCF